MSIEKHLTALAAVSLILVSVIAVNRDFFPRLGEAIPRDSISESFAQFEPGLRP